MNGLTVPPPWGVLVVETMGLEPTTPCSQKVE
jgi:hypothetical protein